MTTCGTSAAAIIYAYSGMALYHLDQPAKEITQTSGLPSSDGAPIPETTLEIMQIERLDRTWEKVVQPILLGLSGVQGIDSLKSIGWQALLAITAPESSKTPWSLEYLLSARFISGHVFGISGVAVIEEFAEDLESDAIRCSEIPSWGSAWMVKHLPELLDLVQEMIVGVNGVTEVLRCGWVRTQSHDLVIPSIISRIWSNLLRAVAATRSLDNAAFVENVKIVVQRIISMWEMDPSVYLPVSTFGPDGCLQDLDDTRLTFFTKLVDTTAEYLGHQAFTQMQFVWTSTSGGAAIFGAAPDGRTTATCVLLTTLLRSASISASLSPSAKSAFEHVLSRLLDLAGSAPNYGSVLGDITNALPWLFAQDEALQVVIWRALACRWRKRLEVETCSSTVVGEKKRNHTGALLISLLVTPFRKNDVNSAWHSGAAQADLEAWSGLLKVTIQRFRSKGVESNEGVLDEVARQLSGFFKDSNLTR